MKGLRHIKYSPLKRQCKLAKKKNEDQRKNFPYSQKTNVGKVAHLWVSYQSLLSTMSV